MADNDSQLSVQDLLLKVGNGSGAEQTGAEQTVESSKGSKGSTDGNTGKETRRAAKAAAVDAAAEESPRKPMKPMKPRKGVSAKVKVMPTGSIPTPVSTSNRYGALADNIGDSGQQSQIGITLGEVATMRPWRGTSEKSSSSSSTSSPASLCT